MAAVILKQVVKRYNDRQTIIHGIDLEIADGEFVVFVGPSGCGKSTLLRMIAGLEDISGGELHIGGLLANDIAPAKRGLAMVFQSYALYPHMTVFENMAFALKLAGHKGEELKAQVGRAADILQITHLLDRRPKELSGGQRQRVAIGRAIVRKPEVFLFDEPLSNLDASLRVQMRVELSRLHKELKTTMIYVTHDQVEAMTLGQRIVVINGGRIEQVGTPYELYNNPGNLFVAGFLGAPKMNFVAAEVTHIGAIGVRVRLADGTLIDADADGSGTMAEQKVTLGIRAEHMAVLAAGAQQANTIAAVVGHVEYLGDQTIVYASMAGDASLIALRQPQGGAMLHAGEHIAVHLPPAHCHLFDDRGRAFLRA
ncbi:sn-glycerol-3-phosphate ABC transporter ATP-binding protein UgpC [Massilia sp. P8910]|uniref:ABC transporter ATP-binding protein n=1 Tax=Massilia antarctica TaxID=2765360 RepID=UPI001E2DB396|nr:sn-glycerol-3-phosphate ABC transporter ATP-binding protein UgpC [Massilia antarctica]MCE3602225.1 sn-glycerol-3-phosphate ABC transporter ATP-binding protein UgpC [Massilia antarctica]